VPLPCVDGVLAEAERTDAIGRDREFRGDGGAARVSVLGLLQREDDIDDLSGIGFAVSNTTSNSNCRI